jgi:predicted nucleic acid-binding protein
MNGKIFWDSNLWIYLYIESFDLMDIVKKDTLIGTLSSAPELIVSAQVLNETANVLMKRYGFKEDEVSNRITAILGVAECCPLDETTTSSALLLKKRYQLQWYDSLIVATALKSGCIELWSEDLQDGMNFEGVLTVKNPF